jgi:hypothetical protein
MWSPDSRMWLIDHTRAFRTGRDFLKSENLTRIERSLFDKLRALDRQSFTDAVGKILTKDEIEALFVRRERLVQFFDDRIAKVGDSIVYTIR